METLSPIHQKDRIIILDCLRGVAVCGILIMNVVVFSRPSVAIRNLTVLNEASTLNVIAWMLDNSILEGSMRALFSVLFGAGMVLLATRLEQKEPDLCAADIYYRRLIWLLIFGLFDAYVIMWIGDILYPYALCGLFLFPFRKASGKVLLSIIALLILITMYQSWLENRGRMELRTNGVTAMALEKSNQKLTEEQQGNMSAWNDYLEKQKPDNLKKKAEKEISLMQSNSYPKIWKHLSPWAKEIETTVMYEELFFDIMIFMLLGIVLYRKGVLTGERSITYYSVLCIAGYSLGLLHAIPYGLFMYKARFDFYSFIAEWPIRIRLYQLQRVCMVLGHIGAFMILWKTRAKWVLQPFIPLGQMAFTNYLVQSLICTFFFYGYGLGYYGKLQRYALWYVIIGIWVLQYLFSTLWLRFFLYGPFEWVWRCLTYWKVQRISR